MAGLNLSSLGGGSVPNWQLLQTSTPSGVASVTFSGLSGYSKYRIEQSGVTNSSSAAVGMLQVNGATTGHYCAGTALIGTSWNTVAASTAQGNNTSFPLYGSIVASTVTSGTVEVDGALHLGSKNIVSNFGAFSSSDATYNSTGIYNTTSLVTSIVIAVSNGTMSGGKIELLGAN